ncbi:hypothetical protein I352_04667 [Cryptococcus deuterogattii MMRL2647]|nr:hypothetical protein I352_04667 [Cryptococcus deuterogattii MMRL2647]
MSLHRYFPRPPLALAIHPAPPSRPKVTNRDRDDKTKANLQAKADEEQQDQEAPGGKGAQCTPAKREATPKNNNEVVPTPVSPGSNLPEPPTPALGAIISDSDKEADGKQSQPEQKDNDRIGINDNTSKLTPGQISEVLAEGKENVAEHMHKEPDSEPEPLVLLSPAPNRPLKARLDLSPSVVYPPWKERNEREAMKRLTDVKRPETFPGQDSKTSTPARKIAQRPEIEWTREGVEDILSTVGIQCAYNTERPPSRHWSEPAAAFLLFTHGFFLLRLDFAITWKPEDQIKKGFQGLITNSNDRVFGEMVKAQQAEDRKRKEKEYKERKEEERKRKEKEELQKQQEIGADETPVVPASNAKVLVGETIVPICVAEPASDKAIIATPDITPSNVNCKNKKIQAEQQVVHHDVKHEAEAEVVPRPKATDCIGNKPSEVEKNKPKEGDAKALERAIEPNDAGGFDGTNMATRVLELASTNEVLATKPNNAKSSAKDKSLVKKDPGPLFWTWTEKCEKWRWRNYDAGVHIIGPGGWEERDWQVFADGREVEHWDIQQENIEKQEIDVHDWSL